VEKHLSLRTSLIFDKKTSSLVQRIIDFDDNDTSHLFTFIESSFKIHEINDIVHDEKRNSQLFNLTQGLVFRCHLLHYGEISANDFLSDQDIIIFNFHHALFDFPSMHVFLHDLDQAYKTGQLPANDETTLHYIDCKYE
jgi:hypothetical protein